jgi:hypothetical protein
MDHFAEHFDTLVDREKRLLGVVPENRNDQPVEHSRTALDEIEMAVGNRVERSRVNSGNVRRLGRQRFASLSRGLIILPENWWVGHALSLPVPVLGVCGVFEMQGNRACVAGRTKKWFQVTRFPALPTAVMHGTEHRV